MKVFDALVIGGGPAGAAAAIRCAQLGLSVCLVDASKPDEFKIGESLPPAATRILNDLGASAALEPPVAMPCYGNQSAWGGPELRDTDFIRDPAGPGWRVDRARFDSTLRCVASQAGAQLRVETRVRSVSRAETWRVEIGDETIEAQWLIDCGGRKSSIAPARRKSYDRLIAIVAEFEPVSSEHEGALRVFTEPVIAQRCQSPRDEDSRTLVESASTGWWYTSLLPNGRRVVVFHTDGRTQARPREGFRALLQSTLHIPRRVTGDPARLTVVSAATTRLEAFHGPGWLAAGDAAMSFDPLSSQGIYTALYSGMKAAEAVHSGSPAAYAANLDQIFEAYLDHRREYYRAEARWSENPFWSSRQ